jgi:hypothetical protein
MDQQRSTVAELAPSLVKAAAALLREFLEQLPADQVRAMNSLIAGGARPVIEVEPLCAPPRVEFLAIDANGSRHPLAMVQLRNPSAH